MNNHDSPEALVSREMGRLIHQEMPELTQGFAEMKSALGVHVKAGVVKAGSMNYIVGKLECLSALLKQQRDLETVQKEVLLKFTHTPPKTHRRTALVEDLGKLNRKRQSLEDQIVIHINDMKTFMLNAGWCEQ